MSEYKVVPVEPTAEMMATGGIEMGARDEDARTVWKAMIAAAPAVQEEPVGWVNSDELDNMLDDRTATLFPVRTGFHGKPLYAAPQPAEQPTISAYACTVPDDCETLHWRGQILSLNELASVTQPVVDEEIHVNIEGGDVLTLPLASSGMSAPRFVVHVPAQPADQQPAEQQPVWYCAHCQRGVDAREVTCSEQNEVCAGTIDDTPELWADQFGRRYEVRRWVGSSGDQVLPVYTAPQPAEQQPDATQLVEALTELCDEIDKHEIHAAISKTSISRFKRKARAVLAAHHIRDNGNE